MFRSWGRVGTTIGGDKTEKFHSKNNAVEEFKRLYGEKTGNDWEDRKNFVKHPNKFYPLEIDYGVSIQMYSKSVVFVDDVYHLLIVLWEIIFH